MTLDQLTIRHPTARLDERADLSVQFPGEKFVCLRAPNTSLALCTFYSHGIVVIGPKSSRKDMQVRCESVAQAQRYVQALIDLGEL